VVDVSFRVLPEKVAEHGGMAVRQLARLTVAVQGAIEWSKMPVKLKLEFGNACALLNKIVVYEDDKKELTPEESGL
jgi:hypothetical protein